MKQRKGGKKKKLMELSSIMARWSGGRDRAIWALFQAYPLAAIIWEKKEEGGGEPTYSLFKLRRQREEGLTFRKSPIYLPDWHCRGGGKKERGGDRKHFCVVLTQGIHFVDGKRGRVPVGSGSVVM